MVLLFHAKCSKLRTKRVAVLSKNVPFSAFLWLHIVLTELHRFMYSWGCLGATGIPPVPNVSADRTAHCEVLTI